MFIARLRPVSTCDNSGRFGTHDYVGDTTSKISASIVTPGPGDVRKMWCWARCDILRKVRCELNFSKRQSRAPLPRRSVVYEIFRNVFPQ
ncbi:hypothetical protein ACS0PU_004841 [Formica fusca]